MKLAKGHAVSIPGVGGHVDLDGGARGVPSRTMGSCSSKRAWVLDIKQQQPQPQGWPETARVLCSVRAGLEFMLPNTKISALLGCRGCDLCLDDRELGWKAETLSTKCMALMRSLKMVVLNI